MIGWTKPKGGAAYAGMGERTFRPWLKRGLRHVRLPSSAILIKYSWIDAFLENFEVRENEVDKVTEQIIKEIL